MTIKDVITSQYLATLKMLRRAIEINWVGMGWEVAG